jgi:hypothetical protein
VVTTIAPFTKRFQDIVQDYASAAQAASQTPLDFLVVDISNEQAPVCVASLADQRLAEALRMRVQDGYAYIARVHEAALKLLNS